MGSSMLLHTDPGAVAAPLHSLVEARGSPPTSSRSSRSGRRASSGWRRSRAGSAPNGRLIAPYDLFKMAAAERLQRGAGDLCRKTAVRTFAELRAAPRRAAAVPEPGSRRHRRSRRCCPRALAALVRGANLCRATSPSSSSRRASRTWALRRARGRAARARLPGGPRRRRRRALEPGSHPAVPSRRDQDRPQPDHRRGRRLLQAGDAEEPGQPEPPHRRAGGRGRDRDRGRGDRRAGAGRRPAAGVLPEPAPAGDRFDDGVRVARGIETLAHALQEPHGRRDQRAQAPAPALQRDPERHPLRSDQRAGRRVRRDPRRT